MKNIMLLGCSRSGKSTFSNMLKEKYPEFNILDGDMIKKSYQKNLDNKESSQLRKLDNYRFFIRDIFLNEINFSKRYYILDTVDIYPSDLMGIDLENVDVLFFGTTMISATEMVNIWKKDNGKWLKNKSEEELIKKANNNIEKSLFFKKECQNCHFKFIDTSFNQKQILKRIIDNY